MYVLSELICDNLNMEELYFSVTDYVIEKEAENSYEDLDAVEKNIFITGKFLTEVNDGGFDQYFLTTKGIYTRDTVEFLESIGENILSRLLDEAYSIFKAVIADDKKMNEFSKIDMKFKLLPSEAYEIFYDKIGEYLSNSEF